MNSLDVVYIVMSPVSHSVRLTLYSRIIPCLSRRGGGSQEKDILLELSTSPFGLRGGLVGTAQKKACKKTHRD